MSDTMSRIEYRLIFYRLLPERRDVSLRDAATRGGKMSGLLEVKSEEIEFSISLSDF